MSAIKWSLGTCDRRFAILKVKESLSQSEDRRRRSVSVDDADTAPRRRRCQVVLQWRLRQGSLW